MFGGMMMVFVFPYFVFLLMTSIWEIKFYTPNNIKATKMPIIVSFNERNKDYRYFRLGAISH